MKTGLIIETPWDTAVFGIFTGELTEYSESALCAAVAHSGHYTLKVDSLADKRLLHEYGFYYCDTLLEPWCGIANLCFSASPPEATITREVYTANGVVVPDGVELPGGDDRDAGEAEGDGLPPLLAFLALDD